MPYHLVHCTYLQFSPQKCSRPSAAIFKPNYWEINTIFRVCSAAGEIFELFTANYSIFTWILMHLSDFLSQIWPRLRFFRYVREKSSKFLDARLHISKILDAHNKLKKSLLYHPFALKPSQFAFVSSHKITHTKFNFGFCHPSRWSNLFL